MKKYTVYNVMEASFPNITYNKRHEIMSNVIIEIDRHQYLCIGRCGQKVGYRFMATNKDGKHIYSKQTIIDFGRDAKLNKAGIYDATPNNILIAAVTEALHKDTTRVSKAISKLTLNNSKCTELASHIALWVKLNISESKTGEKYKSIDKALFSVSHGSYDLYYDEKEYAHDMLVSALYNGSFDGCGHRFNTEPIKPLHPASWYQKRAGQKAIKF